MSHSAHLPPRALSSPDLSPLALSQHRAFPSKQLPLTADPLTPPTTTGHSVADPISALRRTSNASFFMFPTPPGLGLGGGGDDSSGSPLRVNSGLERVWASPLSNSSSAAVGPAGGPWSPSTSFEVDSFGFSPEQRRYSTYELQPAPSLSSTVASLSAAVQALALRVGTLEHANRLQDDELTRLRRVLPRPSPPSTGALTSKLQPLAVPFQHTPPSSSASPGPSFNFPTTPPPVLRRASYASGTSPELARAPSLPSLPEMTTHQHQHQGQTSTPAQSPQIGTGGGGRRRSRANSSEIQQAARMRGVSFSSVAPVIAQARWFQGHQASGSSSNGEPINYRALLEQDIDVDPEVFIRRIHETNDQQCSLYLQQRLKVDDPARRADICRAVSLTVVDLALNKFGNFLVSRCLEYGGRPVLEDYAAAFQGNILRLAMDQYGCHPLQKLQECGDQSTKDMIIEEMIGHVETLTQKSAGHVWSKLLASSNPPSFYRRLSETGAGCWTAIARDETGSLIVQSVLENWAEADKSAIGIECGQNLAGLATSQWGSFVVLHLVEHRAEHFHTKILADSVRLSLDHFGAKAVEKAFRRDRHLSSEAVHDFVTAICSDKDGRRPTVIDVALHATGAQLLVLFFHAPYIPRKDRDTLARTVWAHAAILDQNQFGQKILGLAECPSNGI
ncbi:hypothetical protein RQP46_011141 [Phenoliferia psychrophenolica]